MIKQCHRIVGFILLVVFPCMLLTAQTNIQKFEIGVGIGGLLYQGDLVPRTAGSFKTMRLAINLSASKIISRAFSLRGNVLFGGLHGDDAKFSKPEYRQQRNFNFRTPVFELSTLLVWNPLGKNYDDKGLSPYLFGGAGLSFLKIKRDWSNFNTDYFTDGSDVPARLLLDEAHNPPKVIPVIPVGVGIRYGLSPRIAVTGETSYRLAFTDYLDGFSQAANPAKNDHYGSVTIGAVYRIGKKNTLDCPVIRY